MVMVVVEIVWLKMDGYVLVVMLIIGVFVLWGIDGYILDYLFIYFGYEVEVKSRDQPIREWVQLIFYKLFNIWIILSGNKR